MILDSRANGATISRIKACPGRRGSSTRSLRRLKAVRSIPGYTDPSKLGRVGITRLSGPTLASEPGGQALPRLTGGRGRDRGGRPGGRRSRRRPGRTEYPVRPASPMTANRSGRNGPVANPAGGPAGPGYRRLRAGWKNGNRGLTQPQPIVKPTLSSAASPPTVKRNDQADGRPGRVSFACWSPEQERSGNGPELRRRLEAIRPSPSRGHGTSVEAPCD